MASTDAMMNLMNLAFVIVRPNLEKCRPYGKITTIQQRGKSPPIFGLDLACSARELITAFGLYSPLCGQAIAESYSTPSPKGSTLKNPI